jgi:hypothetical protein
MLCTPAGNPLHFNPVLDKGRGTPLLHDLMRNSTQRWMALQDGLVKVVQLSSLRFVICMLLYVSHNNMSINMQQDTLTHFLWSRPPQAFRSSDSALKKTVTWKSLLSSAKQDIPSTAPRVVN